MPKKKKDSVVFADVPVGSLDSFVSSEPGNLDSLLQQNPNKKIETLFQSIYELGYADGTLKMPRKTFKINQETGKLESFN